MDIITQNEARVLGVLIEKENLVPGVYPMSIKALADGCNQKNGRMPRMMLTEGDVLEAVTSLCVMGYAKETDTKYRSTRAGLIPRFEQNIQKHLHLPNQAVPILCVLLLRGSLTPSQIRVFAERMHRFSIDEIEGWLRHMSRDREEPVVTPLPRVEGAREVRWSHTLTGTVERTRELLSISELMDMAFDLQRRIRILEEDALVRSTD